MNLGNCPECGKLYVKTAVGMCVDCYREEEKNEMKVAEYVRDHPRSSIDKIHENTGVKEKTIFRMIKNGRFMGEAQISYPCESCGAPTTDGRLCVKCNEGFTKQVKEVEAKMADERRTQPERIKKPETQRGGGMYTKDM